MRTHIRWTLKGLFGVFALVLLVGTLLPGRAAAYSYSGHKWYQFPFTIVTVDIDPNGRNLAETSAMRNAMSSWSNAGAKFYFVDTTVSGNAFSYYYDAYSNGTLAYNGVTWNWLGYITRTPIYVNTYYPWATNGDPNKYDFESMAVHELGHSLLLYHSSDAQATMYSGMPKGETKKRTLEVDDKNGIKYIYGAL